MKNSEKIDLLKWEIDYCEKELFRYQLRLTIAKETLEELQEDSNENFLGTMPTAAEFLDTIKVITDTHNPATVTNDRMNMEEITGIDLLEDLSNSHCNQCGISLDFNRSKNDDRLCADCYSRNNSEDTAFEGQKGN